MRGGARPSRPGGRGRPRARTRDPPGGCGGGGAPGRCTRGGRPRTWPRREAAPQVELGLHLVAGPAGSRPRSPEGAPPSAPSRAATSAPVASSARSASPSFASAASAPRCSASRSSPWTNASRAPPDGRASPARPRVAQRLPARCAAARGPARALRAPSTPSAPPAPSAAAAATATASEGTSSPPCPTPPTRRPRAAATSASLRRRPRRRTARGATRPARSAGRRRRARRAPGERPRRGTATLVSATRSSTSDEAPREHDDRASRRARSRIRRAASFSFAASVPFATFTWNALPSQTSVCSHEGDVAAGRVVLPPHGPPEPRPRRSPAGAAP